MAYGKDELFATHDANKGSIGRYIKTLGVVAVLVLVILGAVFYFTLPGVGDEVKAPHGLEDAVRDHFSSVEKRETTDEMKFFYCKDYYTAQVKLAPPIVRPNAASEKVTNNYDVSATEGPSGQWTITAKPDFEIESDKRPCWSG